MACRSIGTGTVLEGLADFRIMAYVFWPWSAKRHNIDIEFFYFGKNTGLSRQWRPSRSSGARCISGESSLEKGTTIWSRSMKNPVHRVKDESGCGLKRLSRRSGGLGATIQISAKRSFTRLSKVSVIRESKAVPRRKPSGESSPISPIRCAAAQLNSDPKGNESREKRLLRAENPKVIKQPVLENAVPLTP